jgi:hypothetical protein
MANALSALPKHLVADDETVAQQVKKLMGSVMVLRHAKRLMSVPLPSGNEENAETCVYHGPDTFDRSSPAISDPVEDPVTEEIDDLFDRIASEESALAFPGDTERPGAPRLSPPSLENARTARSPGDPDRVLGVERPVNRPSDDATEPMGRPLVSSHPPRRPPASMAPSQSDRSDSDPTYIGTPFNSMLPRGRSSTFKVVVVAALAALCVIAALEVFVL